jgi:hypothetical protein
MLRGWQVNALPLELDTFALDPHADHCFTVQDWEEDFSL